MTEEEHALQCAYLAENHGESPELIVSCLLHDYGHLLHNLGEDIALSGIDARHEEIGASTLAGIFPDSVVEPIRLHVAAKRFLCQRDSAYRLGLSEASVLSLDLQGGVMSEMEASAFELLPYSAPAVRLRLYDDSAKSTNLQIPGLDHYRHLLESMVAAP